MFLIEDLIEAKSEFKCAFAFAVDLMEKLNELNVIFQGKNVFPHKICNAMKSFTIQLNLLSHQVEEGNLIHFPLLKSIAVDLILNKYSRQLDALKNEFERRFSDFKTLEKEFEMVTAPLSFDCAKAPNECQMELIDIECDLTLKETLPNVGSKDFFGGLSEDNFPHLKDFVKKMMVLFGSTYICEQTLSTMSITKSKYRSQLADENLQSVLRISNSSMELDFKANLKDKSQFHGSH